jgi:hypothetical protein
MNLKKESMEYEKRFVAREEAMEESQKQIFQHLKDLKLQIAAVTMQLRRISSVRAK